MSDNTRFFVITGSPGSGVAALISALSEQGIAHMSEAGRAIVRRQTTAGGRALPLADRQAFAERVLELTILAHRKAGRIGGPVLFDRGVPDVVGYLRLYGMPVPAHLEVAARTLRYANPVFMTRPSPEIDGQDSLRTPSLDEAERTYQAIFEAYSHYEYTIVHLPLAPIEERARFVLDKLAAG